MSAFIPQVFFFMKFDHCSSHSYSSPALGSKHALFENKSSPGQKSQTKSHLNSHQYFFFQMQLILLQSDHCEK